MSAACSSRNTAAGADLLAATAPETLPQLLSAGLDAQTVVFILQSLDSHLLHEDPDLVYRHLAHLHTAKRFLVSGSGFPAELPVLLPDAAPITDGLGCCRSRR